MDHLYNLKQIILLHLNQAFRQLIHVYLCAPLPFLRLISATFLPRTVNIIARDRSRLAEQLEQIGVWVAEDNNVLGFVTGLGEVKIVGESVFTALLGCVEIDGHVELAPSFVLASEW